MFNSTTTKTESTQSNSCNATKAQSYATISKIVINFQQIL